MAKSRKPAADTKPSQNAFDESALAHLTAKIDQTLQTSKKNGRPADQVGESAQDGERRPKKRKIIENGSAANPRRERKPKAGKISSAELLEEIKALGGDEEDLALVADVDSGLEDETAETYEAPFESKVDQRFKDELAMFASSLGFQDLQPDDEEDTPAESDQAEAEYDEEEVAVVAQPEPREPQRKKGNLTFEPRPDWHNISLDELPTPRSDDVRKLAPTIDKLKALGKEVLDEDAAAYGAVQAKSSSQKFMSTIMSSGTQSDKVSALTLAIQESPAHNVKAFESLIGMASKKNRGQAIAALGALVDLLGNGTVLPSDRRLRTFHSQPGLLGYLQQKDLRTWQPDRDLPGPLAREHLALWWFEDWLKDAYFRIIQLLEQWSGDEIEYSRSTTLDYIFGLLRDKPEQEANLLRLLANKLGDRDRKIASRASYLVLQLLTVHPAMKEVVIAAIEQEVLLRPGQSLRTKYYAVTTLNQTILSGKEPRVAERLLKIYFEMFVSLLKSGSLGTAAEDANAAKPEQRPRQRKGRAAEDKGGTEADIAQKLVSAVLTGVNRAVPFGNADNPTLESHLDTLFQITHSSNFNTSVQALMLIQQLAMSKHMAVDRFYRTLYESLLDPRLIASSKQALYLNLLFRALKNDMDVRRVKAFVKRMLQVVNLHQPSFACGVLYLITELEKTFPDLKTLINEPEDDDEGEELVSRDIKENGVLSGPSASQPVNVMEHKKGSAYDGRKRAPEFSNADQSCLWELIPFFRHFHPSVTVFAENLLVRQTSLPKPELANHTLMHFLDKFVYRNPKSKETKRGGSIMQPLLAGGGAVQAVLPGKSGSKTQSFVNSASFWNLKQGQVAAEDVFFHEYFAQVGKPGREAKTKSRKADEDGGLSDAGDEDAEDEIWQALVSSRPEMQDEEDDEDDDDDDDMDVDMDELEGSDADLDDLSGQEDLDSEGSKFDLDDSSSGAEMDSSDEEVEEEANVEEAVGGKKGGGRLNRKELKSLPTFASADDYADMLAGEDES